MCSGGSSASSTGRPSAARQAASTRLRPVALATNGTVRDARGLASITYTVDPCTANCTLISPRTPSAIAIARVCARISRSISSPSDSVGITQAESPECTPASSTCCMTAPIHARVPSQTASTSTSIASSTKRSTSEPGCTGRDRSIDSS